MINEVSKSTSETDKIGKRIADKLKPGDIVGFTGGLGAGKTYMIKSICAALGVREVVNSPTYTLTHLYEGAKKIVHVDCYRLNSPREAELLGLDEYFSSQSICLIEWADKIKSILPESMVNVTLERVPGKPNWRKVAVDGL